MVELQPSKLVVPVRSRSPAPIFSIIDPSYMFTTDPTCSAKNAPVALNVFGVVLG